MSAPAPPPSRTASRSSTSDASAPSRASTRSACTTATPHLPPFARRCDTHAFLSVEKTCLVCVARVPDIVVFGQLGCGNGCSEGGCATGQHGTMDYEGPYWSHDSPNGALVLEFTSDDHNSFDSTSVPAGGQSNLRVLFSCSLSRSRVQKSSHCACSQVSRRRSSALSLLSTAAPTRLPITTSPLPTYATHPPLVSAPQRDCLVCRL